MSRLLASSLATALLLVGLAAPGLAATAPALNAQSFQPAAGLHDGSLTRTIQLQGTDAWHALASLHYTRKALRFINSSGDTRQVQTVLGDLWMLDVGGSYGYGSWIFEAGLPTAVVVRGGGPPLSQTAAPQAPAFGDLRLGVRRHLLKLDPGAGVLDLGVRLGYALPTAAAGSWLGGSGTEVDAAALATWAMGPWLVAMDAGVRLQAREALTVQAVDPATGLGALDKGKPVTFEALSSGSVALLRALVGRSLLEGRLRLRAEAQYRLAIAADVTRDQDLFELHGDADWALGRGVWRVFAGGGTATTSSWGSAQARLQVGLRFTPGLLPSDRDADGIDDRDDRCPDKAEDRDGYEDGDGCPELDNDGDGVPDSRDRCPLVAEDLDGVDDADGCPDPDNDGDGVLDARDRCPTVAEDRDQHEDADGCPDPDNDKDGIADVDDLCPDKAENINGFEDQDGCPDVAPPPLVIRQDDRLRPSGRITFDFGTVNVSATSRLLLDAVAAWLKQHPEVKALQVEGHTDDNGKHEALVTLSLQRAEAVKAHLLAAGALDEARILARGFGDDRPVAPNDTLEGRTRNRRIDLVLLDKLPEASAALPKVQRAVRKSRKKRRR